MTDFYNWSQTAATNSTADSTINWAEFQDPSTVNDSARALMARIAGWRADVAPTRSSTGTGNAYAVTSAAGGSGTLRDGEIVAFIADRANTSACTLNVNSRGAKPFRPAVSVAFQSGEIQANQPIFAFYNEDTDEWLAIGSGYHVNAMTSGLLTQSVAARLIKIGTPVLSIAPTAPAGYIRLTESTQTLNKSDWPELDTWLSGISYPWGSTSTTFSLPPAAGYFLRFAGTTTGIDPSGPRTAGSTQTDLVKAHTHTVSATGTTSSDGDHTHTLAYSTFNTGGGSGFPGYDGSGNSATSFNSMTTNGAHTHTVTVSGTAAANTGTENRPLNVAFHVDIFASSTLSAGTLAMFGFPFEWDTGTTAADPGTAKVRGNNATLASITNLYISETDDWGVGIGSVFSSIVTGTVLKISKVSAQANVILMTATGAATDNGAYRTIPVSITLSNGSFSANDTVSLEVSPPPATQSVTSYAVASLPTASAGLVAFATDGRKNGEGGGLGTGVLVFADGTAWRACDTGATVAA